MSLRKLGRAFTLFFILGFLLLFLVAITEKHSVAGKQGVDGIIVVLGFIGYLIAFTVILPRWNASADLKRARRNVSDARAGEPDRRRIRLAAAATAFAAAVLLCTGSLRMSLTSTHVEVRASTLELVPALATVLVTVAILITPFGFLPPDRSIRAVAIVQCSMLALTVLIAIFGAPYVLVVSWSSGASPNMSDYWRSVYPLWVVLPIVAFAFRWIRHRQVLARDTKR